MIPRLYIDAALAPHEMISLHFDQTHYLLHVLRRKEGDRIVVFNGRDGEFHAHLLRPGKKKVDLYIDAQKRPQRNEGDLWLCFPPLQRSAMEMVIEKGTELGVALFQPILTRHSNPHRMNIERFRLIAKEAAEQTERVTLPRFADSLPLESLLADWPGGRILICCAEAGPTMPIFDSLKLLPPTGPFAIMTGPEGGYSETELDLLSKFPFVRMVGLGPRILRAETAVLASLAIFQAILGDGKEQSPRPMRDEGKEGE